MPRKFEIRDPVHGFVHLNGLEREVINHPAFQRLRRIRQLAWTEMVYPGAVHTRFEHSIGVMHVASRLFRTVCRRSRELLKSEYEFDEESRGRQEQIIRLAALVHDIGHTPFSHGAEELLPTDPATGKQFSHEQYSAAILKYVLAETIDNHPKAESLGINAEDVKFIFTSSPRKRSSLVWKALLSGQMDADRMDYLLRDSHHAGVAYGRYDLERLADTVEFCEVPEEGGHELGVGEDGVHAVEALLIARYMMFTQVYFHKTRAIYDFHLVEALKEILKSSGGKFPPPTEDGIKEFLKWDDWRVVGELAAGGGGDHGRILRDRNHFRCIHETAETPSAAEMLAAAEMHTRLKELGSVLIPAEKSWYQPKNNILVAVSEAMGSTRIAPLSERSPVVSGMKPINRRRIYVPMDKREAALEIVRAPSGENHV